MLNGTSRDTLLADLCAATEALRNALDAVRATEPNGRDYADPAAYKAALDAHTTRLARIEVTIGELAREAERVADG